MQQEYERLIKNLSSYPAAIRDDLIKGVSATKTALDALDRRILDDKVSAAIDGFLGVLNATNDVLEEIATSPAGAVLEAEHEKPTIDPVPVKRKKQGTHTESQPDEVSGERDD
jgi:hypothetical protein